MFFILGLSCGTVHAGPLLYFLYHPGPHEEIRSDHRKRYRNLPALVSGVRPGVGHALVPASKLPRRLRDKRRRHAHRSLLLPVTSIFARPHLFSLPTQETLLPPPTAAPLEVSWKAPPPGFDVRTLRRQASNLRAEAAAAFRDEEAVRRASLRLAEAISGTIENANENVSAARERLCRLHSALRRLRGERVRHGEAVKAAVAWQESLEELRWGNLAGVFHGTSIVQSGE